MVDIDDMWGKYVGGETQLSRPLIYHMIDVGSVAQVMWSRSLSPVVRDEISRYLKVDVKDAGAWMSFWAGLHDLGKASPAFQAKRPEAKKNLQSKGYSFRPSDKPHGLMTAYLVRRAFGRDRLFSLPSDLRTQVCFSLGGHHGIFPDDLLLARVSDLDAGIANWEQVRTMLVERLAEVLELRADRKPAPDEGINATFFTILSGLTSVADWIASSETFFGMDMQDTDLERYAGLSRERAQKAIENLRWDSEHNLSKKRSFNDMFPFITKPYSLQEKAIELAERLDQPGLIVVEAPMGEGKTEAALYLAERWSSNLGQDGFYIALPTQATADQMFSRTVDYLKGCGKEVNLALLHGHAVLSAEYQQIRIDGEVPDEPGYEVTAGEWFTHRKRGILSPYGVGTIDQALLSVLPTKHFFVRLFGLAGKVVIIDEVHSYDLYTSTLLDRLLMWLKALGSSIIMLSATLPSSRRNRMLSSYKGRETDILAEPYPRISWVVGDDEGNSTFPSASLSSSIKPQEIALGWVKDDPKDINRMIESAIANGGTVAVICNTVAKAQDTYTSLKEHLSGSGVDVDLFHARYPYGQRKMRQDRVLANFGKKERDISVKRVLVATQVIEQSLDLDFDLMITEIAPVDLVLQRMGRLYRHCRERRPQSLTTPTLFIIEPKADEVGVPDYGSSRYVYSEHILLRSQLSLSETKSIRLPADIEDLVEKVYSGVELPVPSDAWNQALAKSKIRSEDEMANKESKGIARVIPLPTYDRPWDSTRHLLKEDDMDIHQNLQAQTRDSPPNVSLICLYENEAVLSLDPEGKTIVDLSSEPSQTMILQLLDRAIAISNPRIVRTFKDRPTPPGWIRSSLLNHYKVAAFRKVFLDSDYCCPCGETSLMLSEEVGLYVVDGGSIEL